MKKIEWILVALILIAIVAIVLIFVLPKNNVENTGDIFVNGEALNKDDYDDIDLTVDASYIYPCTEDVLYLESNDGTLYFYNIPENTYHQITLYNVGMTNIVGVYGENEVCIEVAYAGSVNTKSIITVDYTNANIIEEVPIQYETSNIILSEDKSKIAYEKENSLYVSDLNGENERILLEGTVGGESTTVGYNPIKFIDETRILYHSGAWEGSIGFGIIDTETLENTFYSNGLAPIGYDVETDTAYCEASYSVLEAVKKVNMKDGSAVEILDDVLSSGDYYSWEWSDSNLSKIVMAKEEQEIEVYDTNTEELIYTITLEDGSLNDVRIINDTIFIDYYKVPDGNYEDAESHFIRMKI